MTVLFFGYLLMMIVLVLSSVALVKSVETTDRHKKIHIEYPIRIPQMQDGNTLTEVNAEILDHKKDMTLNALEECFHCGPLRLLTRISLWAVMCGVQKV